MQVILTNSIPTHSSINYIVDELTVKLGPYYAGCYSILNANALLHSRIDQRVTAKHALIGDMPLVAILIDYLPRCPAHTPGQLTNTSFTFFQG